MQAEIVIPSSSSSWQLTGQFAADQPVRSISVASSPFTIGRGSNASLSIVSPTVSTLHAELRVENGDLWVKDLGSTNGTFINGVRVEGEARVHGGDLLQFAEIVLRVSLKSDFVECKTIAGDSSDRALALIQFDKLISERAVLPHFQPIVEMGTQTTVGFEVLGRSPLFGLGTPHAMFSAAAVLDLEAELSRMLRIEGIFSASELPGAPLLFVNTHPAELLEQGLLEFSLHELRDAAPHAQIVLEIHEAAATSVRQMRELRCCLNDLGMKLAYDDFGAGQARLVELGEAPPDYLKFDIQLIRDIDQAVDRQRMVASFVRIAADLGIYSLAEGIETTAEHSVCCELGFNYGQGFCYGMPAVAGSYLGSLSTLTSAATIGRAGTGRYL